jgi:TolB-like protein/Tfp pilus assembly protein PilF
MEYLSDGIAEAVINSLAQLRLLRVVPRATAFRYKGSERTASEIGRKLGVRLVLTGQLVQRSGLLCITAELVEVLKDSQIWGERYDRKIVEILQVEREIGKEIAERLELELSREDHNQLAERKTESSDAHLLVLKAWHAGRRWSPDGLRKGLEYATQAIEADPSYADAHASLAYMYVYAGFASLSPHDTFPRAKAAASRALDLDPHLSVAHAILAMTKIAYDRDWSGALEECRRAIELAPNLPAGHFACSHLHLAHGRFHEALEEARLASDLDPLSSPMAYQRAAVLYYAGQEEEAVAQLEKFEYLDPSFLPAHELLAVLYARANRPKEALEEAARAVALSGSDLRGEAILAIVSATVGRESEARIILDGLERTSVPPDYKWSISCALIHALLGQRDLVLHWLDKACQGGGGGLNFVRNDPHFAFLRDDPSFHQILSRMGLNNQALRTAIQVDPIVKTIVRVQ